MYSWMRLDSSGSGTTKGAITCESLKKYQLLVPPLQEQKKILAQISRHQLISVELIDKTKLSIKKLQELKQILISEAVTGKIKV